MLNDSQPPKGPRSRSDLVCLTLKLFDCDIRSRIQDGWAGERGKLSLSKEDLSLYPRLARRQDMEGRYVTT